jgi:hypothetical protein
MKKSFIFSALIVVCLLGIYLSISIGICSAATLCASPVQLYDVSHPTAVIGDGTPASCTQAALQTAANGGGTIVFNCGPSPTTITLS